MRASLDGGASKLPLAKRVLTLFNTLPTINFFVSEEGEVAPSRVCDLAPCGVVRKRNWIRQWLISRTAGSAFRFKPIRLNKQYGGKYGERSYCFHGPRRPLRNKLPRSGRTRRRTALP